MITLSNEPRAAANRSRHRAATSRHCGTARPDPAQRAGLAARTARAPSAGVARSATVRPDTDPPTATAPTPASPDRPGHRRRRPGVIPAWTGSEAVWRSTYSVGGASPSSSQVPASMSTTSSSAQSGAASISAAGASASSLARTRSAVAVWYVDNRGAAASSLPAAATARLTIALIAAMALASVPLSMIRVARSMDLSSALTRSCSRSAAVRSRMAPVVSLALAPGGLPAPVRRPPHPSLPGLLPVACGTMRA